MSVVLFDHRQRSSSDSRDVQGCHPVHQRLGNEAVTQGIQAHAFGESGFFSRVAYQLVPIGVSPRMSIVAGEDKCIGRLILYQALKEDRGGGRQGNRARMLLRFARGSMPVPF